MPSLQGLTKLPYLKLFQCERKGVDMAPSSISCEPIRKHFLVYKSLGSHTRTTPADLHCPAGPAIGRLNTAIPGARMGRHCPPAISLLRCLPERDNAPPSSRPPYTLLSGISSSRSSRHRQFKFYTHAGRTRNNRCVPGGVRRLLKLRSGWQTT